MEAEWLADRSLLRQLLEQQPEWTNQQLEEENRKLKQLVADLSLDKHMLQEVIQKKL